MNNIVRGHDIEDELDRLDRIATNLDAIVRIPGTRLTLGLDSVLGLLPVIGDTLALVPSLYIILEARRLGASNRAIGRMSFNVGVDYVVGLVPLVGDIFDFGWKSNLRNTKVLREDLGLKKEKATSTHQRGLDQ